MIAWITLLLIAMPVFCWAGNLITNGGFEEGTTGWEKVGGAKQVALDGAVAHSGKQSLRVSGAGGMRSCLVPYRGGTLKVSGWGKTERVVVGSKPWFKTALQLISYDKAKKSVGHSDVVLLDGTHDWTRFERTVLLSSEVAYVAVHCTLLGPDVQGCAWFDDIALEQLGVSKTRALDLQKATVTVKFHHDLGEFRHLWIGSDVGHMDRVTTSTQINAMRHARQFGFRYVRMHHCIHAPTSTRRMPQAIRFTLGTNSTNGSARSWTTACGR